MVGIRQVATVGGIAVGVLVLSIGGLYFGGVFGLPDASLEDNEWGEVDDRSDDEESDETEDDDDDDSLVTVREAT